jgi:hypothetical protein
MMDTAKLGQIEGFFFKLENQGVPWHASHAERDSS